MCEYHGRRVRPACSPPVLDTLAVCDAQFGQAWNWVSSDRSRHSCNMRERGFCQNYMLIGINQSAPLCQRGKNGIHLLFLGSNVSGSRIIVSGKSKVAIPSSWSIRLRLCIAPSGKGGVIAVPVDSRCASCLSNRPQHRDCRPTLYNQAAAMALQCVIKRMQLVQKERYPGWSGCACHQQGIIKNKQSDDLPATLV